MMAEKGADSAMMAEMMAEKPTNDQKLNTKLLP
jgi:hypothetical protein